MVFVCLRVCLKPVGVRLLSPIKCFICTLCYENKARRRYNLIKLAHLLHEICISNTLCSPFVVDALRKPVNLPDDFSCWTLAVIRVIRDWKPSIFPFSTLLQFWAEKTWYTPTKLNFKYLRMFYVLNLCCVCVGDIKMVTTKCISFCCVVDWFYLLLRLVSVCIYVTLHFISPVLVLNTVISLWALV